MTPSATRGSPGWVIVKAIDHTNIDLDGWMAGPWRNAGRRRPRQTPAPDGPLRGEKIALIASRHDTTLPAEIGAAGGRIMANVGRTTTMLVVAGPRPFSSGVRGMNASLNVIGIVTVPPLVPGPRIRISFDP